MTPYIIAELSANHNGSLDRALALVDAAAAAGCNAIKLQTYTPDTMTLDYPYKAAGLWEGKTLYELYAEAMTPWEWHEPIFERARQHGLDCISTPFDASAVDFLVGLGVDALKIASFEITDQSLIEYAATKCPRIILSTGMATEAEISLATICVQHGHIRSPFPSWKPGMPPAMVVLKCLSAYPAPVEHMNLLTIAQMVEDYGSRRVGLSDHTLGHTAAVAAVALGATVIEKHLTLSRADGGPDAAFSAEPAEMAALVAACRDAYAALGSVTYGVQEGENPYYRRSIIVTQDIPAGGEVTRENVRVLRPCIGLPPKELPNVLGRRAAKDIKRGQGLQWEVLV